jgi:hypothetical protein
MTPFCWRLVDVLSRWLEPREREAVRGDIAESGENCRQALRDVAGLVVRRQAALWKSWRPWVALSLVAVPLGITLGRASARTAHTSAIYIWLYANNWDWALVKYAGFRHDIAQYTAAFALSYFSLVCAAWVSGFALGWLSRRAVPFNAAFFCLIVLLTKYQPAPFGGGHANAPVFALAFYRVAFPWIVQVTLVLLPSLWGMRFGSKEKIPCTQDSLFWFC